MKSRIARKVVRVLAILISLTGASISHHLVLKHLHVPSPPQSLLDRACTAFETSSCEEVLESKWATITIPSGNEPIRVPTAQLGLLFFVFMFCWLMIVGHVSPERWMTHLAVTALAMAALGACVFLAVVMYTTLPKWCPLCAATHGATLLLVISLFLLWPVRRPAAGPVVVSLAPAPDVLAAAGSSLSDVPAVGGIPPSPHRVATLAPPGPTPVPWPTWRGLTITFAVAVLMLLSQRLYVANLFADITVKSAEFYRDFWAKQFDRYDEHWQHTLMAWGIAPYVPLALDGEPVRGPARAPHTIVVFSDFQCPTCGKFEEWFRTKILPMSEQYGGVKVVFKHWPICKDCNPYASRNLHPAACMAARAAEAARILGGNDAFWRMHDLLFSKQDDMKAANEDWFVARGRELGFLSDAFREAMNSKQAMNRITANAEEGQNLGRDLPDGVKPEEARVESTPAVYVDNRPLRSWRHATTWQKILGNKLTPTPPRPATTQPVPTAPAASPARQGTG